MFMNATTPAGRMSRKMRYPKHDFSVKQYPYQVQPFMIAQVLPGETLKSASLSLKAITPPLNSTLLGWWAEQYVFYVKLSQLGEEYKTMVIDQDYDAPAAGLTSTTDVAADFFASGATRPGINYVAKCLDAILPVYFRDDDEALADGLINSRYSAKIVGKTWTDSLKPQTAYDAATVDLDVDLDGDATITASEVTKATQMYLSLMQSGMVEKTYEDFLASYGIKPTDPEVQQRPELVRYMRDWTVPTRLVDPADGSPTAACTWAINETINKPRFFKEPGFLFAVQVFRPKVYLKNVKGSLTSYLQNGLQWLPGELLNNVANGIESFATLTGPFEAATANYALDLRDLLLYGEQFVNHDLSAANGVVSLPSLDATDTKYATTADVQALFTSTDYNVESDGTVRLRIASHLSGDHTPNA